MMMSFFFFPFLTLTPFAPFIPLVLTFVLFVGQDVEQPVATTNPPAIQEMNTEKQVEAELPNAVEVAIKKAAFQETRIPVEQLQIIQSEPRTWPDGCLGLADSETVCTQALVRGWAVIVQFGEQQWQYRTNESGSLVKLEQ